MRKLLKSGTTALMLICVTGDAWAASANSVGCANPEDMFAVRTAAVQQRLMVAALSCHAIEHYNKFVTTYQKDLQASDRALQNFFLRLNDKDGIADYHSFKTRLANTSSIQSFRDTSFCADAQTTFDAALNNKKDHFPRSLPVRPQPWTAPSRPAKFLRRAPTNRRAPRRAVSMKLAGILATLLLGIAGPAAAADFYAFEAIEEDSIVLIEPGQIQVMDDGHQVVSLHTVTVDDWGPGAPGPFASLDSTTVEMDCSMPRWRVISESLYLSLSPSGEKIDETNVNLRDWHTLRPGGIRAKYHTFVCQWPASSQGSPAMAFPDIWAASTAIADVLEQQKNH